MWRVQESPVSDRIGDDSMHARTLLRLQRNSFDYFIHEVNPANGLVQDRAGLAGKHCRHGYRYSSHGSRRYLRARATEGERGVHYVLDPDESVHKHRTTRIQVDFDGVDARVARRVRIVAIEIKCFHPGGARWSRPNPPSRRDSGETLRFRGTGKRFITVTRGCCSEVRMVIAGSSATVRFAPVRMLARRPSGGVSQKCSARSTRWIFSAAAPNSQRIRSEPRRWRDVSRHFNP